jgi:uncharacterized protein (DUF1330 family)
MIKPKLTALATVVPTLMGAASANAEAHAQPLAERPAIVFFLSVINPEEPEAYERYSTASAELLHEAGAVTIGRFGVAEGLLGDCKGSFFGYAEVDNTETLEGVFSSEAYKALLPDRAKAFTSLELYFGVSNAVGPNAIVPSAGSAVMLTLGARSANGDDTSNIAFPDAKVLASFGITQHIAGACDVDVIQVLEQDADASQMAQAAGGIDSVFLLKN